MTPSILLRRSLSAALLLVLVFTLPAFAAGKRRAVAHPTNPDSNQFKITGVVLDNATSAPVVAVGVEAGERTGYTDSEGRFSIETSGTPPMQVTFARTGYNSKSVSLSSAGIHDLTVRLDAKPTVLIERSNGTQLNMDLESITFGYPSVFSGYVASQSIEFCRGDGSRVTVHRTEIAKIIGPATVTAQSGCCAATQLLRVNVELKNGQKGDLFFVDSCFTTSIDIIGRNHHTGLFEYIRFANINEVAFP
ncbi:MAG TPA: hypothetical protein VF701_12295 [Thermoanaerobaculia bacterium]